MIWSRAPQAWGFPLNTARQPKLGDERLRPIPVRYYAQSTILCNSRQLRDQVRVPASVTLGAHVTACTSFVSYTTSGTCQP